MKKLILALTTLMLLGMASANAQTAPAAKPVADGFVINAEKHDFGKIPQSKPVYTWFEFKHMTDSLKLEMVQAGCGCTTPEFKAGTYAPGETVKIKVGFNAAAEGYFNKPITIYYNDGKTKVVHIEGTVEKLPDTPAPSNGALGKIKQ